MLASKPVRKILLSILVAVLLCIIFYSIDLAGTTTHTITHSGISPLTKKPYEYTTEQVEHVWWALAALGVTACLAAFYIFYIVIPQIVYDNAKRHGRNAVRWTTAFVVFTPVLAGIVYLLTWPKSKKTNS
jgi:TRAP-type C4-dicarboxylate transport system permease small subunit